MRDVVQTLTCRDEIIVPNEKINHAMLRRADWITLLTTKFDSIGHHVKNDKRGTRKHKAATVLPNRTAAT